MAKKKSKKNKSNNKFEYSNEIVGVIIILLGVIGLLGTGIVGNMVKSFAIFLVGTIYVFLLILLIPIGILLIFKKEPPNLLSSRMIGIYIIIISFLVLLHVKYIEVNGTKGIKIITETFNNLMISFSNNQALSNSGGGLFGALFSYLFVTCFGKGANIVVSTMFVLGIILVLNVSILDMYNKIKPHLASIFRHDEDEDEEDEKENSVNVNVPKDDEIITDPAIVTEPLKIQNIDDDVPIIRTPPKIVNPDQTDEEDKVIINSNANYRLPPINLLNTVKNISNKDNEVKAKESIGELEKVLKDFDISGKVVQVNIGPTVTQFELEINRGTKVSKLLSIQREIALALAAKDVRIEAPIPGKSTIGIELPNKVNSSVSFKEILNKMPNVDEKNLLAVGLGKDIMGKVKWMEINSTPHLLVAGATGSGKSVCVNCIITSILMRTKPDQVKLVMIDPKKVELTMYNGIPHLLAPVVTDPKKAAIALKNIVAEMEKRYDIFERTKNKNIKGYNRFCENNPEYPKMPYIVVIIDELADLMLVAAKEVEDSIMRITQMARAAGIHLIVATQRPSTDVITGVVKANIPSRISFAVSSSIDSRTILDSVGAEKLLGKGDMLFLPMGDNHPTRIQGAFISEEEIQKVVDFVCEQQKAQYDETLTEMKNDSSSHNDGYSSDEEYEDPLYNEIVEYVISAGKVSASLIQRKYRLGYNRAARIIDLLEERGIIGPPNGSKPREVLVKKEEPIEE
ncbi:MAG: cell division protein FtsK [Bacilli bacterium]|nr:cell division protein FtsK [Bacilli bacterium]